MHSREYPNPREDMTRKKTNVNGASEDLTVMTEKLESMDRIMKTIDQSIQAIQLGCDNCNGSHLWKFQKRKKL